MKEIRSGVRNVWKKWNETKKNLENTIFRNFYYRYVIHREWAFADMKEVTFIRISLSQIKNKRICSVPSQIRAKIHENHL